MKIKAIGVLIAAAAFAGCGGKQVPAAAVTASSPAASQQAAAPSTITGKVLETMNAGGYTYLKIAAATGDIWAAVPETSVKKGATVTIAPQMIAEKFESNTLHRKFDRLVMGALEQTAPAMDTPAQHMSSSTVDSGDAKVQKADGGISIADAWAQKRALKDKPVVIRGRVVKFLPDIMGKNWAHLRDGSGSRKDGTDDVTVTTQQLVKVGDVVTVRGTLHVGKDFGAGYVYPIIVEDAAIDQ